MGTSADTKHMFNTIVISFISILLVFAVTGYGLVKRELEPIAMADAVGSDDKSSDTSQKNVETTPKTASLSVSSTQAMAKSIQSAMSSTNADVSVSVIDIKTGDSFNYGDGGPFLGASVNKLVTATLVLHLIDQGKLSLNTKINGQTCASLLTNLVEQSDNDAWQSLNDYVSASALTAWAKSNGWDSYSFDDNEVDTADIANLLDALYTGTLLSEASKQILLLHLANANEANHIVQNVPSGVSVYHKAGWLTDYLHDAAIIDNGSRPYVLVIFVKEANIYGSVEAATLYRQITRATLAAFGVS